MNEETVPEWRYRVMRWEVPVDDKFHAIGGGKVLHVDCRSLAVAEVWTEEFVCERPAKMTAPKRAVRAFGTGQSLGASMMNLSHIGSCLDGQFVWHLYEMKS